MENQKQQQKNSGGFTVGFSLGAVAGAAFAYFLHTDEGKVVKKELAAEFTAVKAELVAQGLLPSVEVGGLELLSHIVGYMADHISEEAVDTPSVKKDIKRRRKSSPTLAKTTTKKRQKKFSGV